MSVSSIARVPERCLWAALVLGTIYNSYRYPLQLNFSGTSPTYSDTPITFQATKFFLVLILCLVSIGLSRGRAIPARKVVLAGFILCMSIYPILRAPLADDLSTMVVLGELAFWPLAAFILVFSSGPISIKALNRYFRFVFFYFLASNFVEVLLFVTIGRLPALAYENTFAVRFGGFLDDPNGASVLIYGLMGWSYYYYTGKKRVLAEVALVLCVLLTQSFTAFGYLLLLCFVFAVYMLFRRARPFQIATYCILSVSVVIALGARLSSLATLLLESRIGSIQQHVSQVTEAKVGTGFNWLYGTSTYTPSESWWVGSLGNLGLGWYLVTLIVVLTLFVSAVRRFLRAGTGPSKAVFGAVAMYASYFVFGCLNLPLFAVFPINFLFFVLAFLVFFDKLEEHPASRACAHLPVTRIAPSTHPA